jgi:hypothetical protein
MAQIQINISTDNQAFEADELGELVRILNTVDLVDGWILRDINGNVVGEVKYLEDFDESAGSI